MFLRIAIVVAAATVVLPHAVAAQTTPERTPWEFRVSNGAFVPAGAHRRELVQGNVTAAQLSYEVSPRVVLVGTGGWGRTRGTDIGAPKVDVFSYDIGTEVGPARPAADARFSVRPFLAAGAGGRAYNQRGVPLDAVHNATVYAGAGGEIGVRRVHLRVEARDYAAASTRHEVVVLVGVRFGL
jgi:hypothetical protein